jgi:hypothetical protein
LSLKGGTVGSRKEPDRILDALIKMVPSAVTVERGNSSKQGGTEEM